ncbi:MAG: Gfo/Idh/MocA family oxidoreductase [candidate division WOR-3 bacterium]|nr:MAG: Gfo/Idh/MocA family oxidoreductase [candidate division WOR-3 bacterium]
MSAIGLIGLGSWGAKYVDTLTRLPEAELLAVHDASRQTLDEFRADPGVRKMADLDEFLSLTGMTSVVIATPASCHFDLALRTLEAGLDVLVEKPMTDTAVQASELLQAAESLGRVVAVGHIMLHHPSFQALRESVRTRTNGRVAGIESIRTSAGPADTDVLADLACHDIAMAIALKGAPVAARARRTDGCGRAARFELMFGDETLLRGQVAWADTPPVRTFRLHCNGSTVGLDQNVPNKAELKQTPLARQCLDFIRCCATRRAPVSDAGLGVDVMHTLDALRESAGCAGRWVATRQLTAVS